MSTSEPIRIPFDLPFDVITVDCDLEFPGQLGAIHGNSLTTKGALIVGNGTSLDIAKDLRVGGKVILRGDAYLSVRGDFTFTGERLPKGVAMWIESGEGTAGGVRYFVIANGEADLPPEVRAQMFVVPAPLLVGEEQAGAETEEGE